MIPFIGDKKYDEKCIFLDSVEKTYEMSKDKYIFDFSKITEEQQTCLYEIIEHVNQMRHEWKNNDYPPFKLRSGDEVTTSWKYEYIIFELVRLYKTFDWKKNVLVYYGY
jgi:hypothetical protein